MATRRNQHQPATYLSFDGASGSYVSLASTAVVPDGTTTLSGSVWVYLSPQGTGSTDFPRDIIGNQRVAVTSGWKWNISDAAKDKVEFTFHTTAGGPRGWISNTTVSSYRWVHIGFVFNGTNITFYIDGNPDVKETISACNISEYTGQNIRIGHREAAGATFETFAGKMSDLCLWNRVLTAAEFLGLYNARTTPTNNLIARWVMNEGSGTTITDSAGGFTGTLVGGVTWATAALNTSRSGI